MGSGVYSPLRAPQALSHTALSTTHIALHCEGGKPMLDSGANAVSDGDRQSRSVRALRRRPAGAGCVEEVLLADSPCPSTGNGGLGIGRRSGADHGGTPAVRPTSIHPTDPTATRTPYPQAARRRDGRLRIAFIGGDYGDRPDSTCTSRANGTSPASSSRNTTPTAARRAPWRPRGPLLPAPPPGFSRACPRPSGAGEWPAPHQPAGPR